MGFFGTEHDEYSIIYFEERRKVLVKEVVIGTLVIIFPLILLLTFLLIISTIEDIDARVLWPDIFFFFCLSCFALAFAIILLVKLFFSIKNKEKVKGMPAIAIMFAILVMMCFGSYKRAEDALKDYHSEDSYIIGIIETIKPGVDGSKPTIKFVDDANIYELIQLDAKIQKGAKYKFKYYKNSNLISLIEQIEEN